MRQLLIVLLSLISTTLYAQIPTLLLQMIDKYPTADHRIWYYYDHKNAKEYYSNQFSTLRKSINTADVTKMSDAYLSEFNHTDFKRAVGALYRSPDSISITVKGTKVLTFDLGTKNISGEWGKEVKTNKKWLTPDFRPITTAISLISKGHKSKKTHVSYTGFAAGVMFVFHRGEGRGMTKGVRTTLYNTSSADFDKVRQTILTFIGKPVPVTVFDYPHETMIKSEIGPDFYAIKYHPTTKTLYFLHATVENEICIPDSWQIIDHLP